MLNNLELRDGEIKKNWYIACLSKDLKRKPIQRTIYDQNYVLFRDKNGSIGCLQDRCSHRGTPLSKGRCTQNGIQCSYHGWVFNTDGVVTDIPSEGKRCKKVERKVNSLPTFEKDEVVWVWLGDPGQEDHSKIWSFPYKGDNSWVSYYMVTDFRNEVTNLVENFIDVPHTVWVHRGWFRNRSFKNVPTRVTTDQGTVLVDYKQPGDDIGVLIKRFLNPKNEPMIHTDQFIYPNITNVSYSFGENFKYVINSQCTPVSTFKTRVYTHIGYKVPIVGRLIRPLLKLYTRQVIEQDVVIMNHQKQNLINEEKPRFQSTEADEPHIQIERLRALGIKDQGKIYQLKKERNINFYI